MGLSRSRLAEHEQRSPDAALMLLGDRRALDLAMELFARLGVDGLDVKGIALVDLRAVRHRREHLRTIVATERDRAWIGSSCARRLEEVAKLAARRALDLGCATREHLVHDAREH